MRLIIKNAHVMDPGHLDAVVDIYIDDEGKILRLEPPALEKAGRGPGELKRGPSGKEAIADRIIDASGYIVTPGLIDMHVHLREPGEEYKETIETGTRAAAAGGFTAVCCMPNTFPVNDNRQVTEYIVHKAAQCGSVRVYPVAAISRGLKGEALCDYGELKEAGAIALSDDGRPVVSAQLMRRALEYSRPMKLPVISHCEEIALSGGVMNEGPVATRLGLSGIPNAAESIMVMRDITLCELTGVPVHIAHVSARESVAAIREAKARGVPLTAETAPHYFSLTDEAVGAYRTHSKMYPPLRAFKDREAIRQGLADDTIDAIATDHAPHSVLEKDLEFDAAANGIIGLETSLGLGLRLVAEGVMTFAQLIEKMSIHPAQILGLPVGIRVGNPADITIIDPDASYVYRAANGFSKSRNTPFDGWEFKGRAKFTIVDGRVVFEV